MRLDFDADPHSIRSKQRMMRSKNTVKLKKLKAIGGTCDEGRGVVGGSLGDWLGFQSDYPFFNCPPFFALPCNEELEMP
jgi:hypothetical protein